MNNYHKHAMVEFQAAGWCDKDGKFNEQMQELICKQILDLLGMFGTHGHSGTTAPYAINLFEKLARFEPIVPLTGEEFEWNEVSINTWQNKRCSHVFKDKVRAYDIHGKVFVYPDGGAYTNRKSHVTVAFPYIPKIEYVNVDNEGNEIQEAPDGKE